MKNDETGFSVVEVVLLCVLVCLIAATGLYVWQSRAKANKSLSNAANAQSPTKVSITKTDSSAASPVVPAGTSSSKPSSSTTTKKTTVSSGTSSSNKGSSSTPTQQSSTDPTITITSPSEGQVITGSQFTLSCTHTTPNGYQSAEAIIQNVGGTPYMTGFSQGQYGNCSVSEDASSFPNGNYIITFTVTDNAGKTATATRHFTIQH